MTERTLTTADDFDWAADDDGMGGSFQFGQLTGTLHANPDDDGVLPCCGRSWTSVRQGEGWTGAAERVQCTGPEDGTWP